MQNPDPVNIIQQKEYMERHAVNHFSKLRLRRPAHQQIKSIIPYCISPTFEV